MVPADSNDLKKEYSVLLNELKQYNPELLDKERLLAITKCDLLDDELMEEIKEEFPKDVKTICISSVSQTGLMVLKDEIWKMIHNGLDS